MINQINQKFILNFHIMFHQSEKNYKNITIKTKKNHSVNGSTLIYLQIKTTTIKTNTNNILLLNQSDSPSSNLSES